MDQAAPSNLPKPMKASAIVNYQSLSNINNPSDDAAEVLYGTEEKIETNLFVFENLSEQEQRTTKAHPKPFPITTGISFLL